MARFEQTLRRNRMLTEVLARAARLDLPGWYLVAGCLCQTVWNVASGQPPEEGILDYDLAYFDASDLSWAAEDAVIQAEHQVFGDLSAPVQIRNQARVHLWYPEKFGIRARRTESTDGHRHLRGHRRVPRRPRRTRRPLARLRPIRPVRRVQPGGAPQPGPRPARGLPGQGRTLATPVARPHRPALARDGA